MEELAARWQAEAEADVVLNVRRPVATMAAELRLAMGPDAAEQPPADGLPRFTITRGELVRAMAPVWPIAELPDLADLADAILANLGGAPVPGHEHSYTTAKPWDYTNQGPCQVCGEMDGGGDLASLGRLNAALEADRLARESLLWLADDFARRAASADRHGMTRAGTIRAATFREASAIARRHATDGPPVPDVEMAPERAVAAPGASEAPALVSADGPPGTQALSVDPGAAPADRCPRCESTGRALHPAMQADGGEVQICPHPWHQTAAEGAPSDHGSAP
jgi:hypothetical protein